MAEDDDSGLPEEGQNRLEQENAVLVEAVGPYYNFDASSRQIFEDIDDLYDYGTDIIYGRGSVARGATTLFIVVDNSDESDLLYPNQPHYWIAERLPPDPSYVGDDDTFRGDVYFTPFYKKMVEWAEEGKRGIPPPQNSIIAGTYRNVSVYLPDPVLDYSRPESQTGSTTGATTGTTVQTTTTILPGTTGGVTESETIPAEVGLDAFGGAGAPVTQSSVSVGLDAFGGAGSAVNRSDPLDAFGGAGDAAAAQNASVAGGRGNGAAEVAQRQANAAVSRTTTSAVATGTTPCLPNNPPAASGTAGSGATPPTSVPYDDAILRQARAAAAAPASVIPDPLDAFGGAGAAVSGARGGRGNGAAELAQRRADATATSPTTVTQPTSTPRSSATASIRPPNVYIYEPLTPGFDRYDFNTGKKVYTPDAGPSRNTNSQPVVPQATPRVPPIDGGIAVGTTTGGPSLLRRRSISQQRRTTGINTNNDF